jgi:hypothetical protein
MRRRTVMRSRFLIIPKRGVSHIATLKWAEGWIKYMEQQNNRLFADKLGKEKLEV